MYDVFDCLRRVAAQSASQRGPIEGYLDSFRSERPSQKARESFATGCPAALILRAANSLLMEQGFDVGRGIDAERLTVRGRIERDLTHAPWLAAFTRGRRDWRFAFEVQMEVTADGKVSMTTSRPFVEWVTEFRRLLIDRLTATLPEALRSALLFVGSEGTPAPTVLGPGEMLDKPFRGTLRDYSGCATREQVLDLSAARGGCLPLGRYRFDRGKVAETGPELFLSPMPYTGALREHGGTLVCAPLGSGKTELLVRWAKAANAAGYNLFIVDVKGTLARKLNGDGRWRGSIHHFTTDPDRTPGDDRSPPCEAMNLLERIDPWAKAGLQQIRQLAEAILPADGMEDGEMKAHRANWVNWLTTLIHLVLVDEAYAPFSDRRADLSDVYDLAGDEDALIACVRRIAAAEKINIAEGRHPPLRLRELFNEIAVLLPMAEIVPDYGEWPLVGQRAEHSYRWLTENILAVLRPFRAHGLLGDKISGADRLPRFNLEAVAGLDTKLEPASDQVTVLLSAREQEGDEAKTVLSMTMARLQKALFERMRHSGDSRMRPVLLLLDETRRIRNFKANEYVSFAREAEAGCVVVYQSLEQIGDKKQIAELLENVGTQIYLGSLVRNTAREFVETLPKRHRPRFTLANQGAEGLGTIQVGQEEVDYFSTADLYVLPAGRFPALIYLNDQPRRAPILVSLDR